MANTVDTLILQLLKIIAESKLFSELTEQTVINDDSFYAAINTGTSDAKKIKIPLLRGYNGDWNASTNTPALINATGVAGTVYRVSVAGTRDLGNGSVTYGLDEIVYYNGSKWVKLIQSQISDIVGLQAALDAGNSAAQTTLDNTNLVVVPETELQAFAEGVDHNLLKSAGTGVDSSYTSSVVVGGTTFTQGAFEGEIKSDEGFFHRHYAGASGVTVSDLTAPSTYVYVDKNLALQQQISTPNRQDWVRKIFTMRIAVNTVTNQILGFEYLNNPIGDYTNSTRDVYSYLLAQGVPFKKDQIITGRASDLGFDISQGSLLEFGGTGDIYNPNIKDFDLVENADFFLSTRTAFDAGGNTNLPKFWDNAGAITALGSTTVVGHRLFRFSNGNVCLQYGQANYANMTLAKAGVSNENYVLNPALKNSTFFGWWLIEETATNTGGSTLTEFIEYVIGTQGGSSSSLSGAVLKSNNASDFLDYTAVRSNIGLNTTVNQTDSTNKRFMTDAQESKLDGVETNADVTDATNVTAAGALMDSELASIADVKALNQSVVSGSAPIFDATNMTNIPAGIVNVVSNVATARILGRDTAGSGNSEELTATEVRTLINVADNADVTGTTNVTVAGALMDSELTSIADVKALNQSVVSGAAPVFDASNMTNIPLVTVDVVSNVAQSTILGRYSAGSGNSEELSVTLVRFMLNVEDGADETDTANVTAAGALMDSELASIASVKGLDQDVSNGSSPVLDATNMTNIPAGTVDVVSNVSTATILGRNTAGSGNSEELTATAVRTLINVENGSDVTDATNVAAAGALMLTGNQTLNGELKVTNKLSSAGNSLTLQSANGLGGSLVLNDGADTLTASFDTFICNTIKPDLYAINALNSSTSTPTDSGSLGQIKFTATHIEVCVATNTWKKVPLNTTDPETGEFEYTTTTSTALTLSYANKGIVKGFTSSSAINVTINSNSLTNVGDIAYVDQMSTGVITFVAGSGGAVIQKNASRQLKTDGQFSRVAIHKVTATAYRLFGELASI